MKINRLHLIGGCAIIGFIAGLVFCWASITYHWSQVDPPPFMVIIFTVAGAAIGFGIDDLRQPKKEGERVDSEERDDLIMRKEVTRS